jgi:hypothetical protein
VNVALTVLVHEPMGIALPLPEGWSVQATEDGSALSAVGGDELGSDRLNPSVTVERKGWSSDWAELVHLAEASLAEMTTGYAGFALLWSREHPDTERVARAYSYEHPQLGAVTQVQALVNAGHLVLVTCTAPSETYDGLASTFERIVQGVQEIDTDDLVEEADAEDE